jgi:hypothetical protein
VRENSEGVRWGVSVLAVSCFKLALSRPDMVSGRVEQRKKEGETVVLVSTAVADAVSGLVLAAVGCEKGVMQYFAEPVFTQ